MGLCNKNTAPIFMEVNMAKKKKIPCRVCGKLFEPCAYCQSHSDVFRWRNFACSRECAVKYINDTVAYRESLKNKAGNKKDDKIQAENSANIENSKSDSTVAKRKCDKKTVTDIK